MKVKNYLCDLVVVEVIKDTIKWQYALICYTTKERNFLCSFNIIIQHITDFYSIVALIGDKVYFEYKAKERNQARWSTHPSNSIYDIS